MVLLMYQTLQETSPTIFFSGHLVFQVSHLKLDFFKNSEDTDDEKQDINAKKSKVFLIPVQVLMS